MIRRRFLSIAGGLFPLLIPIIPSTTDEHPDDDLNDDPDGWGPPDRKLHLDRLRLSEVDQAVEIITSEELVERTEVPRSEVNALLEFAKENLGYVGGSYYYTQQAGVPNLFSKVHENQDPVLLDVEEGVLRINYNWFPA